MGSEMNTVKAGPTKEFFVTMITRDILLPDAIVELIDNSIDGIKRQKAEIFSNSYIHVQFTKDFFEIKDNCGGIDKESRAHAFVFGKPQSVRETEEKVETTGTFGIGMKRALFKMGQKFEVKSESKDSSFLLSVDVVDWMKKRKWDFPLIECNDNENNDIAKCGTKISVTRLFPGISQSFDYNAFVNEVINTVQTRHSAEITKGLEIIINNQKIEGSFLSIINDGDVLPYKYSFESENIKVMVIAGISAEREPDNAGWYIYCNNREILSADKSPITTWRGEKDSDGMKYHNDFASFRGFVFFTSIYPELLPWNTSKTGVDTSSQIYKMTQPHMVDAFRIIISELRKLARLDEDIRNAVSKKITENKTIDLHYYSALTIPDKTDITFVEPYAAKVLQVAERIPMTSISYSAEKAIVDKVKKALNVSNNRDVGLRTFEYFIDMEEI